MDRQTPKHIAIIMDGNGRWAKKRLLPKKMGHKAGAETLDKIVKELEKTDTEHLTVYAFSTENWKRSEDEIKGLMSLLKEYIGNYIKRNNESNVRIDTIGDISVFDDELRQKLITLSEISSQKTGLNLHIALNYGGRDELTRAIKEIAKSIETKKFSIDTIDENLISSFLDTKNYPDPELVIRSSGEYRISNFLPWQSVYSEFCFIEKLWPDFEFEDIENAIDNYKNRERRFGGRN